MATSPSRNEERPMKQTSVVLGSLTLAVALSVAGAVQAADGPVKLTPLASHDGEFCRPLVAILEAGKRLECAVDATM